MTDEEHPFAKTLAMINAEMTLVLVRGLVTELSTELDLHYDRDKLRSIREEDTVQILVEGAKFLHQNGYEVPEACVHVLNLAGEEVDYDAEV